MPALTFKMPTRLVHGIDSLDDLAQWAHELGMRRPLFVTDPVIKNTPVVERSLALLEQANIPIAMFDECEVDARLRQVSEQTSRILQERLDGLICVGGGSVMCAGKAMAICATHEGRPFSEFAGLGGMTNKALPQIMVPTTAGSGSEVSQMTLVKDEVNHRKFVGGGPLAFPDVAILDPIAISSLPPTVGAQATVDALSHCIDSLFNHSTTALTAGLAVRAAGELRRVARTSIFDREPQAMADHLLASSMANMSCGNARLGLAHCLSLALEANLDLLHPIGVGTLAPRVMRFNAEVEPTRLRALAQALGASVDSIKSPAQVATAAYEAALGFYEEIGFQLTFTADNVPQERLPELAMEAGKGLYGEGYTEAEPNRDTLIASPNARAATIAQGEEILAACFSV
ncbi:MAG: iron-containing alcohol dehydrogenase [Pseudomonadota bacterium]